MYVPRLCYMHRSVCAPHSLISTLILEQNIKHFVGPDLGPTVCQLSAKLVCHILFGGGGGGGDRVMSQRDRVMVHGHGLRSKKPTIRPRVVVVLRLG